MKNNTETLSVGVNTDDNRNTNNQTEMINIETILNLWDNGNLTEVQRYINGIRSGLFETYLSPDTVNKDTNLPYSRRNKLKLFQEFINNVSEMGNENTFVKLKFIDFPVNPELTDSRIYMDVIHRDKKLYCNNSLWCDNDNEYIEVLWYNHNNSSIGKFRDTILFNNFLYKCYGISIPFNFDVEIFGLERYYELMKNKIQFTD
jgi:hypothetical protein